MFVLVAVAFVGGTVYIVSPETLVSSDTAKRAKDVTSQLGREGQELLGSLNTQLNTLSQKVKVLGAKPPVIEPMAPPRMAADTSEDEPMYHLRYRSTSEICNMTAPLPVVDPQPWNLGPTWKRVCAERNREGAYPHDRNWCWVGMKRMCHWNIKNHVSWATIQQKASDLGIAPPASVAPYSPLRNPELCDVPSNGASINVSDEELVQAREWFKNNVAVYVLSLPTSNHRWEQIEARLRDLDIWATRVPGVDMRLPNAIEDAKKLGFVPKGYNFTLAQETGYSWKHDMGSMLGTLGCASAHFKVQQKAIADGSPLAIVMEDDTWPSDDFIPRLWKMVREELPCDWEAVALLSRCGYGRCVSPHLARVEPDPNEPRWRCHQGVNWGMHSVLYRTEALPRIRKLWKKVVFNEEVPRCMDVDVALASISDKVGFYSVPSAQDPGFLRESTHRSARWDINEEHKSTQTTTTVGAQLAV